MSHSYTPTAVLSHIKRQGKAIKKSTGSQHAHALDLAARESGFQNFRHAQNQLLEQAAATKTPAFPLTLIAHWGDRKEGKYGHESLTIELPKPWQSILRPDQLLNARYLTYFRPGNGDAMLTTARSHESQFRARTIICGAARELVFAEATGLKPSSGHQRAYPSRPSSRYGMGSGEQNNNSHIPGQDHVSAWFDPVTRRYLLASEPYEGRVATKLEAQQRWCEKFNYTMMKPEWPGTYAPQLGSRMNLFTSATKGVPLDSVVAALNALPAPVVLEPWTGESVVSDIVSFRKPDLA